MNEPRPRSMVRQVSPQGAAFPLPPGERVPTGRVRDSAARACCTLDLRSPAWRLPSSGLRPSSPRRGEGPEARHVHVWGGAALDRAPRLVSGADGRRRNQGRARPASAIRARGQDHGARRKTAGVSPAQAKAAAAAGARGRRAGMPRTNLPVLTLDRFEQAMQIARLAAVHDMPELSLRAVREALAAGPPVVPANPNEGRRLIRTRKRHDRRGHAPRSRHAQGRLELDRARADLAGAQVRRRCGLRGTPIGRAPRGPAGRALPLCVADQ